MLRVPLDVINDIFLQLPVKSLVRFRSLSKPLRSLIDDPDFIKSHLANSIASKSNYSLILKDWLLYTVDFDSSLDSASDLDHPLRAGGGTEAVGSCNGLVALRHSERNLAIYNISTRKGRRLPVAEIDPPHSSLKTGYVFYGFGFDPVNDDYKLLRMAHFVKDDEQEETFYYDYDVRVYSLKADSWKAIKNLPFWLRFLDKPFYHILHRRGYGVFANHSLHWMLPQRPIFDVEASIVSFDLVNEVFGKIPQPNYEYKEMDFQVDIGVLEGFLCALCNYEHAYIDVWMMMEYGVKESWSKVFSVLKIRSIGAFMFLRPLVYSKDGEKVLLEVNDGKLLWYDWKKRTAKIVRIRGVPESFSTEMYVGSLVPVKSGDDDGGGGGGGCGGSGGGGDEGSSTQEQEENRKSNGKKRDHFLSVGFKLKL